MARPEELGAGRWAGAGFIGLQEDCVLYTLLGGLREAREPWGSKRFLPWKQLSRAVCLLGSILGEVRNYSSGPAPGPLGQNPWGSLCVVFSTAQPMCSRACLANTCTRRTLCVFKGVINKHIYTSDTSFFPIVSISFTVGCITHPLQYRISAYNPGCPGTPLRPRLAQTPNLSALAS